MITAPDRRNSIGGLRMALASLVIYTHAYFLGGFGPEWLTRWSGGTTTAGTIGVQCFFVLSGWLVTLSWRRYPLAGRFLWHRFLRLAPALWVCLAVTAFILTPLLWLTSRNAPTDFFSITPSSAGYVWHNLINPRSQIAIGTFPDGRTWAGDWNGSLWTIYYEGSCYLIFTILGVIGLFTRFRILGTVAIIALLTLNCAWTLNGHASLPSFVGRLYDTPGKLLTLHFFAGAALASWPDQTKSALRHAWVPLAALAVLIPSWHFGFHSWISPFMLPLVLLWIAYHGPLQNFEAQAGGDYSYGLYVYGYPVQQTLAHFGFERFGFTAYLITGYAIALALGVASWHLIEKRALAIKSLTWPQRSSQ